MYRRMALVCVGRRPAAVNGREEEDSVDVVAAMEFN